jgi:hypothetical protein
MDGGVKWEIFNQTFDKKLRFECIHLSRCRLTVDCLVAGNDEVLEAMGEMALHNREKLSSKLLSFARC